jgi:folylpolyglutamate synthase
LHQCPQVALPTPKNIALKFIITIFRKPKAVGITSLGLDHTSLLGNTVELIAWQKAGIMKPSVPAFSVQNQPGESLKVLQQRAKDIGVGLN